MARITKLSDFGFDENGERLVLDEFPSLIPQIVDSESVFPDTGISGQKISELTVDKLRAGTINSQEIVLGVTATEGDVYLGAGTFDATTWTATGGILIGMDDSDSDKVKVYFGDSGGDYFSYVEGTGVVISGTLVAGSIHIPDQDTTANSFHVDTTADTWWGCTNTNWTADPDNATAYILNTGVAKFQSITLSSNVTMTDLQSGSILTIQGWTYDGAFTVTDADTVAWASGTLTTGSGQTFAITGANTGNMAAKTYVYFDSGASTTVFQTSTTRSDAFGLNKILVAVAENQANEATFFKFGDEEANIDGANIMARSVSATEIVANTVTANEIAATTITGAEILTMNISGKNATFDTGSIGGFTMGATSLTDTAGTMGMSSAVTGGDDIRFWAGHTTPASAPFYVTEAGALVATSATITGVITVGATSSGIANFSDGGDLVTVDEANVDALNLTNAPAEAGADVTGSNTAADTALVSGLAAANVAGWAAGADTTKIDGGDIYTNTITATSILTLSMSGKNCVFDTGTVGGWTMNATDLYSNNVKLESDTERILIGSATAPLTGTGVFIGKDGADYELRVGDPDTDYMHWGGTSLQQSNSAFVEQYITNIRKVGDPSDMSESKGVGATIVYNYATVEIETNGGVQSLLYSDAFVDASKDFALGSIFKCVQGNSNSSSACYVGVDDGSNNFPPADGGRTADHAAIYVYGVWNGGSFDFKSYLSTADGTTQTVTEFTGITVANYNSYKIVKTSSSVKLYVNGVLKAINTTNLPDDTTSNIKFCAVDTAANDTQLYFYSDFAFAQTL